MAEMEAYVLPLPTAAVSANDEAAAAAAAAPAKKRKTHGGAAAAASSSASSSRSSSASGNEEEQRAHGQLQANRWLLLAATGGLESIRLGRMEKTKEATEAKQELTDPMTILDTVLHSCRAKIDFQDERGFSAVVSTETQTQRDAKRSQQCRDSYRIASHTLCYVCAFSIG